MKYRYSHPDVEGGRVYTTLPPAVRDLGAAVYKASLAPPAQDSQHLRELPSGDPLLPKLPENLDATRALEQVQQIVAADGATQP